MRIGSRGGLALLALALHGRGEASVIGGLDASRSACQASFPDGSNYAQARGILSTAGNSFLPGVPSVTPGTLAGLDAFVVSGPKLAFSAEELCALESFVRRGGAFLQLDNRPYPTIFGVGAATRTGGNGVVDFLNPADPDVAQLRAGIVPPVRTGFAGSFAAPPGSVAFLSQTVFADPVGVLFSPAAGRAGRAIVIGDEEIFAGLAPMCAGAAQLSRVANQQLLSNAFDWLLQATNPGQATADTDGDGYDDLCDPAPYEDLDGLCPCDASWDNHGDYVSCVAAAASVLRDRDLIAGREHGTIVSSAARSDCGS